MHTRRAFVSRKLCLLLAVAAALIISSLAAEESRDLPIRIGSRLELFVDDFLIDRLSGVDLKLQTPRPAGNVLSFDKAWEGTSSTFVTVFQDGDRYRMYYRAGPSNDHHRALFKRGETPVPSHGALIAYAESRDGIHWERPALNLYAFQGSKQNNIVWVPPEGVWGAGESLCMYVFRDQRPAVPDAQRYKALAGSAPPLLPLVSPDGLRWTELQGRKSLIGEGLHKNAFDNLTPAFWDAQRGFYAIFFRDADMALPDGVPAGERATSDAPQQETYNYGNRSFKYSTSADFITWSYPRWVDFGDAPHEQLYTNPVIPYFRAPHIFLAWPMRLLDDWRKFHPKAPWPGVSDVVFMSSRDYGAHWDRPFMEAFIRPGRDPRNWTDRSNLPAWGLLATAPDEISLYLVRNYHLPTVYLERMVLRTDGFVSVHAGYAGGEFVSKPLIFEGGNLGLNYATSAAGSIRVEIQDGRGQALPGFSLEESALLFGDEIEHVVQWERQHPDFSVYPEYEKSFQSSSARPLARLSGKPVRLRFVMKDADLYSIQFR